MTREHNHDNQDDVWGDYGAESKGALDETFGKTTVSMVRIRTYINDMVFMLAAAFASVSRAFLNAKSEESSINELDKE